MNPQIFLLPLTNIPQQFNITLADKNYIMTVRWNDAPDGGWLMGLADQLTGDQIVDNIAFTTGVNILDGLDYLGIGGQMVVYTNGNSSAVPTLDNLGVDSNVYFISPPVSTVIG